jgi:hypothetical protein
MDSEIIATLIQENEDLNKKLIKTERMLKDEEEISEVLSRRIHIIEQEFRSYVEKMQIYLQTEYKQSNEDFIQEKEIARSTDIYKKPNLYRSTNEHEWTTEDILTNIVSLEI